MNEEEGTGCKPQSEKKEQGNNENDSAKGTSSFKTAVDFTIYTNNGNTFTIVYDTGYHQNLNVKGLGEKIAEIVREEHDRGDNQ